MANEYVFNNNSQPLDTEMVNTYRDPGIIAPPENSAGRNQVLFSSNNSASGTVVLSLLSVNASIRIANGAGSGKTMYISRIICGVGGSSLLSAVSGSVTITSGGTLTSPATVTPANNYFGSSRTSVMTVQTAASAINGGTTLLSFQLAPGAMQEDFWGQIVVPPGQSLCVNTFSSSSSIGLTIISSVSITWWEA